MRIVVARRVSQAFFAAVFLWFCAAASLGGRFWQLSGWPVNWLIELDPLAAFGTLVSTRGFYAPLFWAVASLALTAFLGRFFCGFVCPLGALNQATGWLARIGRPHGARVADNRLRPAQAVKFYVLGFFLACGLFGPLLSGLLDPIPLLHRSVNLTLAPVLDSGLQVLSAKPRSYASAWLILAVLAAILGLNLVLPRFFCRFVCPLGALFGLVNRFTPWRIGKVRGACGDCHLCETHCEGACRPSGHFVAGECVLCLNCLDRCPHGLIGFGTRPSVAGESALPEPSRRAVVLALAAGALAAPVFRVGALAGFNRNPQLIRPPGALDEARFLARCLRCGQCMRVCPTNVLQPALLEAGIEGIWTPVLNNRIGHSGCQLTFIACGHVCPTAAIRPLTLDEKLGRGEFAAKGPLRLGTAFVDRSRCLPWVMDRPCLVCQELCPVSPKAIFTRTVFEAVRGGRAEVSRAEDPACALSGLAPIPVKLVSGDYFLRPAGRPEAAPRRILAVEAANFRLAPARDWTLSAGQAVEIVVQLQRPFVDAARCIGCGVCEHECPILGLRGIRVSFENESRSGPGRMLL